MRNIILCSLGLAMAAVLFTGCAGPERKLGRGMNNTTEIIRLGEMRRSVEDASLFRSPDEAYSRGALQGLNKSIKRTAYGIYEIVTFPIPNRSGKDYGPILKPEHPVYPSSYKPKLIEDSTFANDTYVGFSGGDVAPMIPGSRFHVFDE